jgi:hypothetical protein
MKNNLFNKTLEDSFSREAGSGSYGREKSSGVFY